jgi:predicted HNH restriction endonuclease
MRLTVRVEQENDFNLKLQKIRNDDELRWKISQVLFQNLQTEHEATLLSLSQSETAYADLKQSSEARANLDAQALTQARQERDDARAHEFLVGLGGVAVGALLVELVHLLKIIP